MNYVFLIYKWCMTGFLVFAGGGGYVNVHIGVSNCTSCGCMWVLLGDRLWVKGRFVFFTVFFVLLCFACERVQLMCSDL